MSYESISAYCDFEKCFFNPNNYTDTEDASRDYNLEQLVEELLQRPDDNEYRFFIECDLEYPQEIKERWKQMKKFTEAGFTYRIYLNVWYWKEKLSHQQLLIPISDRAHLL